MHNGRARSGSGSGSAAAGINNPSYVANPTLWHAVALQQQFGKISLGPPRTLRGRAIAAARSGSAGRSELPHSAHAAVIAPTTPAADPSDEDEDDDGVSSAPPPTLTLAQRMGLAEAPEPELTTSEWDVIAAVSRQRDASREPCVICQEPFRDEKQTLLSCGHTFHRTCLRSWERHSKSRNCPVCRKQHYQKRNIHDGANLYREECAVRIQASWRAMCARRATAKALRHTNPRRLRRYCEQRLSGLTDRLLDRIDAERSEVDALFAQIDSTVATSRAILSDGAAAAVDWAATEATARLRGLGDCPVCLVVMGEGEPLALLSCSHVFHPRCLASFERFSISPTPCLCPVCRASYTKTTIGASPKAAGTAMRRAPPKGAPPAADVYGLCEACSSDDENVELDVADAPTPAESATASRLAASRLAASRRTASRRERSLRRPHDASGGSSRGNSGASVGEGRPQPKGPSTGATFGAGAGAGAGAGRSGGSLHAARVRLPQASQRGGGSSSGLSRSQAAELLATIGGHAGTQSGHSQEGTHAAYPWAGSSDAAPPRPRAHASRRHES